MRIFERRGNIPQEPQETHDLYELVPATFNEYAVWLEGYLTNGGTKLEFPDPESKAHNGVILSGGFSEWENNLYFATHDGFTLPVGENENFTVNNIILADGVNVPNNTTCSVFYLMDGFRLVNGRAPVYPRPEIAHLGSLLAPALKKGFADTMNAVATLRSGGGNPFSWIMSRGEYLAEIQFTEWRFARLANFFDVGVSELEIEKCREIAESKRQERIRYLESPQYRQDFMNTLELMHKLGEDAEERRLR